MTAPTNRIRRGFTLIEMLATITIIVILAGMVVAGMGFVKEKQRREKAKTQIALLSTACESFKSDNGFYPGIQENTRSGGKNMTNELFTDLYWDSDRDGAGPKSDLDQQIYEGQLDPEHNQQDWIDGKGQAAKILDPWGNEYRYRKGSDAINPDFDLWSAGKDGKTNPENPKAKENRDDVTNS